MLSFWVQTVSQNQSYNRSTENRLNILKLPHKNGTYRKTIPGFCRHCKVFMLELLDHNI